MNKLKKIVNTARKMIAHNFCSSIKILGGIPKVFVAEQAFDDMCIIVDKVEKEVGWIGSVERIGKNFLITEVFLPDQESHAATCEITAEGLSAWATDVLDNREDGMEVVNSIRFWGHSHVDMGTKPSGQDNDQMKVFSESCEDYFIRGILNKKGRMELTLYLFNLGVVINDCPWQMYRPVEFEREEYWEKQIHKKVREKTFYSTYTRKLFSNNVANDVVYENDVDNNLEEEFEEENFEMEEILND